MNAPGTGRLTKPIRAEVSEENLTATNAVMATAVIVLISALVGVALSEKRKKS